MDREKIEELPEEDLTGLENPEEASESPEESPEEPEELENPKGLPEEDLSVLLENPEEDCESPEESPEEPKESKDSIGLPEEAEALPEEESRFVLILQRLSWNFRRLIEFLREKKANKGKSEKKCSGSGNKKRRIFFVLLGLPLGFLGLHFLYAKRYIMCGVTIATLMMFVVSIALEVAWLAILMVLLMFVLWPVLALFGKKDGCGNKMTWF